MSMSTIIDNLSIDCVIFGFEKGSLKTLFIKRNTEPHKGMMSLPGGFIYLDEDIDTAPARRLQDLTGLNNLYLKEVGAFGKVSRYPNRRVITIAYYALVNILDYNITAGIDAQEAVWIPVTETPKLVFDHNEIFNAALLKLREQVRVEPIGFNLLDEKFSISELQTLYEEILDTKFDKRNFRKKLAKMNLLVDTHEKQTKVSHRAAKLYSFDTQTYENLKKKGFIFDL